MSSINLTFQIRYLSQWSISCFEWFPWFLFRSIKKSQMRVHNIYKIMFRWSEILPKWSVLALGYLVFYFNTGSKSLSCFNAFPFRSLPLLPEILYRFYNYWLPVQCRRGRSGLLSQNVGSVQFGLIICSLIASVQLNQDSQHNTDNMICTRSVFYSWRPVKKVQHALWSSDTYMRWNLTIIGSDYSV